MNDNIKTAITILLVIAIFVYSPLVTIWSINQLTNLNVQYTFWTWLAMNWCHIIIYFFRSNSSIVTTTVISGHSEKNTDIKL